MKLQELRKKGYKVRVSHLRRVKEMPGVLCGVYQIKNKDLIDPRGGATEVTVIDAAGNQGCGLANCYYKDTFNKKEGLKIALERALRNLKFSQEKNGM